MYTIYLHELKVSIDTEGKLETRKTSIFCRLEKDVHKDAGRRLERTVILGCNPKSTFAPMLLKDGDEYLDLYFSETKAYTITLAVSKLDLSINISVKSKKTGGSGKRKNEKLQKRIAIQNGEGRFML